MSYPDHLTTENTGYFAGTYYGGNLYYTEAYIDLLGDPEPEVEIPKVDLGSRWATLKPRTCQNPECGAEFQPANPRQRYCKPKCTNEVRRRRRQHPDVREKERLAMRRRRERAA